MKKLISFMLFLVSCLVLGCVTSNSNAYGSKVSSTNKKVDIFVDEFTDAKTYEYSGGYYTSRVSMRINMEQFELLKDFFTKHSKVRCACYSVDNYVLEAETYNENWHMECFDVLDRTFRAENPNALFDNMSTEAQITKK